MNYNLQKEKLLDQLQKASGISFDIQDSELSDEDTISKLRELLLHFNTMENKSAFYKEYFTGEFSASEAALRLNRFHIEDISMRFLVYLESEHEYSSDCVSLLKSMRPLPKDEIIEMDPNHIVFISHLEAETDLSELQQFASSLVDMLESEAYTKFKASFDVPVNTFSQLLDSYNSIVLAMKIGNIFSTEDRLFNFSELGLGRLLFNLPVEECLAYIKSNLDLSTIEKIDEETLLTLNAFFENDLSIAETSRQLFIHRNTLIYRLDKFSESTGLDVRKFKDAMTCNICLMIMNYIKSK